MERMGFVVRIEEDLERTISQGRLPASGFLPSESLLARQYGVSRTTVREALLRLSARGLVVQYPGRKSRAVAMDVAVTLENLSVALHAEGPAHPERRRLLEGYLDLKREMTVELLSDCCERASERDLDALSDACFMLREEARWKQRPGWVEREFNLLRLAAITANRPGHFLLIQSLERSFWGMARRLLPLLDGESICEWALAAFSALHDRDAQTLRRKLPPLLQASDERLLRGLSPAQDAASPSAVTHSPTELHRNLSAEGKAARSEPSQEAPFPDLNSSLHAEGEALTSVAAFRESHARPDAASDEPWSVAAFREPHASPEAISDEASEPRPPQPHIEPDAAPGEPEPEEPSQQPHSEAMSGEPPSTEQVQETHGGPVVTLRESLSVVRDQESRAEPDAARVELMWEVQTQELGTTPGAPTCAPPVRQLQESGTPPGAALGELSAGFCANPSGCWTGSDKMRPTGGFPPRSVPRGFGCPSGDTALGRVVTPVRDEDGETGTDPEKL
jgi:DNA-binding FadR family transcriptional regulator